MEEDISKDVEEVTKATMTAAFSCPGKVTVADRGQESNASKRQCFFCFQAKMTEGLGNYRLLHSKFCQEQKEKY